MKKHTIDVKLIVNKLVDNIFLTDPLDYESSKNVLFKKDSLYPSIYVSTNDQKYTLGVGIKGFSVKDYETYEVVSIRTYELQTDFTEEKFFALSTTYNYVIDFETMSKIIKIQDNLKKFMRTYND